jgi:uncharacterized protein (DUF1697 family)
MGTSTSSSKSTRYVALLRGINVGTAKQLAMADLKALLERLGYADVRTYLRSGQAVFTADGPATAKAATRHARAMASEIEQAIERDLDLTVPVVVRSRTELATVLTANRFATPDHDPARVFCVFLSEPVTAAALESIDLAAYAPEEVALAPGGRELFLWLPDGMGTSKLGTVKWDRALETKGLVATARNWRTTTKLLELLDG